MHQWSETVLIQSEPLLQSPGPHGLEQVNILTNGFFIFKKILNLGE